ncbi:MAG: restriction endonuclease subunit S [Polynucleobacter sp.]|nr:restriction endonuclease subunit S [Polynucleobacter sp.]
MKAGWAIKSLGEVCDVIGGGTPAKDNPAYYAGDIPWATVRDMKNDVIVNTEYRITEDAVRSSATNIIPSGNVVIATRVGLGKICLLGQNTAINQDLRGIIPRPPSSLMVRFLFWWLKSIADIIVAEGTGATVQGVKLSFVKSLQIPVPPLPEQHRIVAILDEALDCIATAKANTEKNLKNAREVFESHLQSVFTGRGEGWVETTVGAQLTLQRGFDITKDQQRDGDVPVVSSGGIKSYHNTPMVKAPGVVIGRKGTLGKCFFIDQDYWPHDTTLWVKDFKGNEPRFVYYLLLGLDVKHLDSGTANPALNRNQVHPMKISWPPVSKQQELIHRFDALSEEIQRLESLYQKKLTSLDELKKSLLHQAFSGQLTAVKPMSVTAQAVLQTTTPEFAANVISLAHARHERQRREKTFGHVKAQKVLQMVEALAKIELGRQPIRDAAGPNDFPHMLKAEDWAKAHDFFEMVKRGAGYEFKKLSAFEECQARAYQTLGPYMQRLESIIDLLVPMDTEEAEVFATVHAAWNNLLVEDVKVTDDAIVSAAREDWHVDKLKIPERKFYDAIVFIRQKGLVPDGTAKYVGGGQKRLL